MPITRDFTLYLNAGISVAPTVHVNQYDRGEQWVFTLLDDKGQKYTPSSGALIGVKADGHAIAGVTGTVGSNGEVYITETQQMTAAAGKAIFELTIDGQTHGTANFIVQVEKKPTDDAVLSESDLSIIQQGIDSVTPAAINETVSKYLAEHMTNPPIDPTLSISNAAADAKVTGDKITDLKNDLSGLIESSFKVDRGLLSVSSENFTDMRASQGWNSLDISYNEHNDGFTVYHSANYNERFCWSFPVEATKTYTITFESTSTDWVKVGVASTQTVNEALWTEISHENGKYTLTFTVNQNVNEYYLCFALKNAGIGQANAITISKIICNEGNETELGYTVKDKAIPSTIARQTNYYSLVAPSYIDLVSDGKWFFYDEGVIDTNDIHASDIYQINSFGGAEPIHQFPTQGIRESDLTDYATGRYTNRLYMCNTYDNNNIDSQLCVINVYDVPTNPSAPKNILMIGDSLTANNYLPYYFQKYLADNGLTNYVTVGRRNATVHGVTYDSCRYEAEGGYSWQNYVDNPNSLPSGFPNNYFWNPNTNELDISYYMDTYANGANLDYVLCNIGWNSLVNQNYWHGMDITLGEIETKAKAFIDQVHSEYPNAKILLTGIQKSPWNGGAFVNSANKPTLYNIRLAREFCSKLNKIYKDIATSNTYKNFVRFNMVSFQFNPYTGMPYTTMETDAFTGETIKYCTNYVHPSEDGYKMFARSIWGGFVGLVNN